MHPGNLLQILPVISPAKKMDLFRISKELGFPGGTVVKNPPANSGDSGLISGSGRSPAEGNDNLL